MKLKDLIARLERIAAEHGNIDVACTENCGSVAEDVALSSGHLVLPNHLRAPPRDVRYLCFMKPIVTDGSLLWEWSIQSGGGWTGRGGPDVHRHAHDVETSAEGAQAAMKAWLDAPQKVVLAAI